MRNEIQWKHKLDLLYYAIKLGHEGYPKSSLTQILDQIQGTSATVPYGILFKMLRFTFYSNRPGIVTDSMSPADLTTSVEILDGLSRRGCKRLPEDVVIVLEKATGNVTPLRGSVEGKSVEVDAIGDSRDPRTAQERLSNLLATFTVSLYRKTITFVRCGVSPSKTAGINSGAYGEQFPKLMRPRSGAMYAEMFRAMAKTKRQDQCIKSLQNWVPEMDIEKPPVKLEGEVAKAVKDCLLVAHPNVKEHARKGTDATGEWVSLWVGER